MARAVDQLQSVQAEAVHGSVPVREAHSRCFFLQQVHRVCENGGMSDLCVTLRGQPVDIVYDCLYRHGQTKGRD